MSFFVSHIRRYFGGLYNLVSIEPNRILNYEY